jgi:histidine triad (HIT) family protein
MNLLQCNGRAAAQSVMHFHMHVMPRHEGDELSLNWELKPGDMDAIGKLAERIRAAID